MRILVISAYYPPNHFGGYEIRNRDIVDALYRRGHQISVVTSRRTTRAVSSCQTSPYEVFRVLHAKGGTRGVIVRLTTWRRTRSIGMLLNFVRVLLSDLADLAFLDHRLKRFGPDVVYLGHIMPLTAPLMPFLAARRASIVFDEGGAGQSDSREDRRIWYKFVEEYVSRFVVINALKPLFVKLVCSASAHRLQPRFAWPEGMHVLFNGRLNQRNARAAGVPLNGAKMIRSGVDTTRFAFRPRQALRRPIRIIVPGRFEEKKGHLDTVRLVERLVEAGIDAMAKIVGDPWSGAYLSVVEREMNDRNLADRISILPMLPQEKLVAYYHEADICFFPSYHRTGFSRVPFEAMASGCIVISYGNEGSDEAIRHGHNGFIVKPKDFSEAAKIIADLAAEPDLVHRITDTARREIEENHSMQRYVDQIEAVLIEANRGQRQ